MYNRAAFDLRKIDTAVHVARDTPDESARIINEHTAATSRLAGQDLNCVANGNCKPVAVTAWLGGQKVLLGEAVLTMRTGRKQVPNILSKLNEGIDTGNRIGKNIETLTCDLSGRSNPTNRILRWGAKLKQAAPVP